jgi:5-formyltetrahydrofolate cyclo-ligase
MTMQAVKQALRQRIIAVREQLPLASRVQWDAAIGLGIRQLREYLDARSVLAYMSFGSEVGTENWVQQALADGKRLLLPKVNTASRELDVYRVSHLDEQLAAGAYGIREPLPERCEVADVNDADFILLPGVAFGRDGARLGYGGGFYDKLLARLQHRPALVAGAYSAQLVEGIPQEATDRKVEWLLTENETLHCGE